MSRKETPLQTVKRVYGGKDKLVEAVVKALKAVGAEVEGEDEQDLAAASNTKLLRLHSIATTINERYGDKDKLIAALADLEGKSKDSPFAESRGGHGLGRLLDQVTAAEHRARLKQKKSSSRASA